MFTKIMDFLKSDRFDELSVTFLEGIAIGLYVVIVMTIISFNLEFHEYDLKVKQQQEHLDRDFQKQLMELEGYTK